MVRCRIPLTFSPYSPRYSSVPTIRRAKKVIRLAFGEVEAAMTLVVARCNGERVSLVADTQIAENGKPLPLGKGMAKLCAFPNGVCVGFANSPELARRDLWEFSKRYPHQVDFSEAVSFFENSSRVTENEYLVAFAASAKVVKIKNGKRQVGISKTFWIGEQEAFALQES